MNYHRAYLFAMEKHKGQLDDTGRDYFEEHCVKVVEILKTITKNEIILKAGILHDVLEDTNTTYEELKEKFGVVADLVNEVTHEGKKDEYGFYFPRLESKEAIMIKLADRLQNITRMQSWTKERQNHYLKKTKFWKDGSDLTSNTEVKDGN